MSRTGSFVIRLVLALLILGGLAAAGYSLFQAGQTQGYALGLAASGEGIQSAAPFAPYYPGHFYRPHFFFFPFGFLFWGFLIFLFLGLVFRRRHWNGTGWHHGYPPPWVKDPQAPPENPATPE